MFKKKNKAEKKKKGRHYFPTWLAVLILLFIMVHQLLLLAFGNVVVSGIVSFAGMNQIIETLKYNIMETEERTEQIYNSYCQDTESKLELAGRLYNRGLFVSAPDTVSRILGTEDAYCVVNRDGIPLSEEFNIGIEPKELTEFITDYEKNNWNYDAYDDTSILFCKKLSDGNYILTLKSRDMVDRLSENLYDTRNLIQDAATESSMALLTAGGILIETPDNLKYLKFEALSDVMTMVVDNAEFSTGETFSVLLFEGKLYAALGADVPDMSGTMVYYLRDFIVVMKESIQIVLIIHLMTWFLVFILMYFIYQYRKENRDRPEKARELRNKTAVLILAATLLTGLFTFYAKTMFAYSSNVLDDQEELERIRERYENSGHEASELESVFSGMYAQKLQMIGAYLNAFPEERTEERLVDFSNLFGMDYAVLFDQEGKEILSSADYINFELSKKKEDPSYRFRSLLNGARVIVTPITQDDLSGLRHSMAGASLRSADNEPDGLIMGTFASGIAEKAIQTASLSYILEMMHSSGENDYYLIDQESRLVTYSPYDLYNGISALDIGFKEDYLKEGFSGTVTIDGTKYSASEMDIDQQYLFQVITYDKVHGNRLEFTIATVVAAMICYFIASLLMGHIRIRFPETDNVEDATILGPEISIGRDLVPEEKTTAMIVLMARIFGLILAVVLLFRNSLLSEHSMIRYVMDGKWREGLNIFALTAVIIMVLLTSIFVRFARTILSLFSQIASPRTETYLRMVRSGLEYFSVLIVGYMTFKMFGMDMRTLVTTTSIMMMLVGMGAQDLTEDIIAGMFLMFESEFQVGDVIDVNGRIGTVKEIGLHSTKLIDENNNLLLMNNSQVKNLINRTQNTSFTFTTFMVPSTVPIQKLEEIFAAELPKVKAKYPELAGVPFFRGVRQFRGDAMECTIAAEMSEADRVRMGRILNVEIMRILSEHDITVK